MEWKEQFNTRRWGHFPASAIHSERKTWIGRAPTSQIFLIIFCDPYIDQSHLSILSGQLLPANCNYLITLFAAWTAGSQSLSIFGAENKTVRKLIIDCYRDDDLLCCTKAPRLIIFSLFPTRGNPNAHHVHGTRVRRFVIFFSVSLSE